MPSEDYRPRFQFDITEEQQKRVYTLFPRGLHGAVFSVLLDEVLDMVEEHGIMAMAAIISKKVSLLDVMKSKEGK